MRYITYEEQKLYEKLAVKYGINGYSPITFMIRQKNDNAKKKENNDQS